MKFFIAPMEGVMDFVFRDLITSRGGAEQATTEFIRITSTRLPDRVFHRYCPELKMGSRTRSGTPVYIQLLGGKSLPMAENAARAAELGAYGIDLNFGCPAPTVNRHDGGASLLKTPDRLFEIANAVRQAVPATIPVTAKMRLGFDSPALVFENARALSEAGMERITIHARTKTDGYKPPAHWEWIAKVREQIKTPIIANGEIWNAADLERCHQITGCDLFMIGRGILRSPNLIAELAQAQARPQAWSVTQKMILPFFDANSDYRNPKAAVSKSKQWLKYLSFASPEASELFEQVKILREPSDYRAGLERLLN